MKKLLLVSLCFLVLCITQVYAQNRTVTGTVVAREDGLAIPGVTVKVKNSTIGTQTDANGKFTLTVPADAKTLTVSFLGFQTSDFAIPSDGVVNAVLAKDTRQLNEVVVSAGGLNVQRREQGYASTTVKPEVLTQGKAINVGSALSGKVAGLQVNTVSSGVNPQVRLVLRGNRSLLGNNQALIVLDNVIVPNSILGNINPEDIEDIQVLNGPGAAALYGSDASNGALIITTKKGRRGEAVIKVGNTTSLEKISFYPKYQTGFGSGSNNDIQVYIPYENQQYGPAFDGVPRIIGRPLEDGSIQTVPYSATNSKNDFWDTGVTNQTDFSMSSGDEKSTLYLAAQYVDQKGTTPGDKYNRVSIRVNGTRDLGNKVSANYNVNYVQNRYDVTTQTGSMYDQILQTPGQVRLTDYADWQNNPFANPNGYYNEYYANPYYTKDNNRQNVRNDYLLGKAELKYRPIDALSFTGRIGITTSNQSYKSFTNKFVLTPYTKSIGTSGQKTNDIPGGVTDGSSYATQLTSDFLANYLNNFGDFKIDFTAGASLRNNVANAQTVSASGLVQSDLYNVDARYTPNVTGGQSFGTTRQLGVYGDLKVGYKDYLTLHVTGRNDWLSVLAPKNRSFFYPSADIAFIPTNVLEFMKDSHVLNSLKLRGTISKVGQANIGAYALNPIFVQASGYPFTSGPGYTLDSRLVSADLKPEITKGIEAGFDADFFDSRISASATYYKTNTTNQTVPTGVSNATGFSSFLTNTGRVDNQGIETSLTLVPVKTTTGLQITVGANYTYNDNKVVSISKDLDQLQLSTGGTAQVFAIKGEEYPVLKGVDYLRDDQGRVIVDPITGYPSADPTVKILGNTNPKHRLGLNAEVRYKSLRLSGLAEYRGGFVIYNNGASGYDFSGSSIRTTTYNRERFVFPNSSYLDAATGEYVANNTVTVSDGGAGFFADNNRNMGIATNYIYNGASWKIREISLTYDLPKSLLGSQNTIKAASIGVQGRNLFLWTPSQNIYTDPEYNFTDGNAIGITTLGQTPPTRYFGATLSITL
ncbi:SusC/RagA family TonB-linked outer membrane protein [Mucilaginibacter segetis]|uniref:SusC/RagA family TonB-linked outer membrane protein n=1 Tax=Mucilaginibacter segetis TaxID=2793071 RepID=A0A934PVT7_9SPHI|nr:SusC/RagA family TonB-linked outer membrane protein [Mucilaginibacter segetis]MBK0379918.1 SusC/RagA family TonB-linked outer membrane protein [Mucilaginibacter segetis]